MPGGIMPSTAPATLLLHHQKLDMHRNSPALLLVLQAQALLRHVALLPPFLSHPVYLTTGLQIPISSTTVAALIG